MKTIKKETLFPVLLLLAAGLSYSVDIEALGSYQLIDHLLSLTAPGAPEIMDDGDSSYVVFTASSSLRRVGVAFADEGFSKVHWFRKLLIRPDTVISDQTDPVHQDSGIVFYIHQIPKNASEVAYRMIIEGLWTVDPGNPVSRLDSASGLSLSVLSLPPQKPVPGPLVLADKTSGQPDSVSFSFKGPPGEIVSVAGSFNNWDPFMYELKENPAGSYSITIPLPPGNYQYVFFHRGQRCLDPYNANRIYSRDGSAASQIVIQGN